ncbi:hypothetical protein ABT390_35585 [Streptomyces aurantiacus]|uniref:Uncharacterized protein n=1 Tax=Streptomyces aurantiacus JA 4570 TaxID=1286094 RepID=S3ZP96_9ACTN|nr:hypothetical protein [Streptomyces aurantiacus]EPH45336.1 hypothetical protein STRAU_1601 [Streptomyces aurantiacus JA 4570]
MTTLNDRQRITEWLARADPNPVAVYGAWSEHGVALLPLGRRFDAVRVPAQRVHAAVGSNDPQIVASSLRDWLEGPVIRDLRSSMGPYYVLISPNAAAWDGAEERLSTDTYLGVPRPGQLSLQAHWVVPLAAPGDLCDPAYLSALLATSESLKAAEL